MDIYIDDRADIDISEFINISDIESALKTCLDIEGLSYDYEISISFVNEEEIRELNREYRNKDSVTDVLSFPLCEIDFPAGSILGDIVICSSIAENQAIDFGHSIKREIIYLIIHSCFHLLGYDHINPDEKKIMRVKEKEAIKKLGVFRDE
ncbi:MAG: rRNA maturation RNase YbeY [Tissierellia bacterium]|nr:rRNA maturation RNase YbeY [Tissierellia bacterium]